MSRLRLPTVTLCSASSVNVQATVGALTRTLDALDISECILFSDRPPGRLDRRIRHVAIEPLRSGQDYSSFMLTELAAFVATNHALVVQWDGFVLDPSAWRDEFLDYDYVGAVWPQFCDGRNVGNGGFSLRSRKLLEACRDKRFVVGHPEDVAIGRTNRELLESEFGCRFADEELASLFSFERRRTTRRSFGFHGVFNMVDVLGGPEFMACYRSLDDRSNLRADLWSIARKLASYPGGWRDALHILVDRVRVSSSGRHLRQRQTLLATLFGQR